MAHNTRAAVARRVSIQGTVGEGEESTFQQDHRDQLMEDLSHQNTLEPDDQYPDTSEPDNRESDPQLTLSEKWTITDAMRAKMVILSFVLLLGLELTTKKLGKIPPSYYMGQFSNFVVDGFITLGNQMYVAFDIISSYCNIKDAAQGAWDLFEPILNIAFAPYRMIQGLLDAALAHGPKESWHTVVTGLFVMAVILTIMEINARGIVKPSSWIGKMSKIVTTSYKYFGRFISDISSFYRVLKLEKFVDALFTLLWPVYKILVAPIKSTLSGYLTEVGKYRYGYLIIGFGTLSLVLFTGYGYSSYAIEMLKKAINDHR